MADARPTAQSRMSPAIRAALAAAALRGVDTAAIALGLVPKKKRGPLVGGVPTADDEYHTQVAFFERVAQHTVWCELPIYAVPNFFGHYGTAVQRVKAGARAMRAGRRKGIPDVSIDVARGGWHGLRIEFKTAVGKLSPQQREWRGRLEGHGYHVVVCKSADEACDVLTRYLAAPRSDDTGRRLVIGTYPLTRRAPDAPHASKHAPQGERPATAPKGRK